MVTASITLLTLSCCWYTVVLANETDNKPETEDVIPAVIDLLTSGQEENSEEEWSYYNSAPYIVGGDDASPGEFPWQVSLHEFGDFFCGGSIINPTTILTAAHCITSQWWLYQYIQVRAGTHRLKVKDDREQRRFVEEVIFHKSSRADIAILKVGKPFKLNSYIQSINLANSTTEPDVFNLQQCMLSGFGYITSPRSKLPDVLQKANVTLKGRRYCKRMAAKYDSSHRYLQAEICTRDKNLGACFGDSGGPMVCLDNDKIPYQVGVVSWGSSNCWKGFNVYARTSSYLDWITKNSS